MTALKKCILICLAIIITIGMAVLISTTIKNHEEKIVDISYQQNVLYLSSHYSLSIEAFSEEVDTITHNINNDIFEVIYNGKTSILKNITLKDPQYTREKLSNKISVIDNKYLDISKFTTTVCCSVKSKEGIDTGYRLFVMDNEVWIGHWDYYGENKDAWWCEYIYRINDMNTCNSIKDVVKMI